MHLVGRFLIVLGMVIVLVGVVLTCLRGIPWLGRLPGDIFYQKGSLRVYFPIMTSVVLSIILTVILNLVVRR